MRGINYLLESDIRPQNIMVYFLCNYWEKGLTNDVWYRFRRMVDLKLKPYPMIFEKESASKELKNFQRWVIRQNYPHISFENYNPSGKENIKNKTLELF